MAGNHLQKVEESAVPQAVKAVGQAENDMMDFEAVQ